jgi:hypothetical protein
MAACPAWLGFYHFFMIKGQAPPPSIPDSHRDPEGLILEFDLEMYRHKKSLLAQALQLSVFMRLSLPGFYRLRFNQRLVFDCCAIKKIPAFLRDDKIWKIRFKQFPAHFHRNVVFAKI